MKQKIIVFITLIIFLLSIDSVSAMTLKPSGASSGKRGDEITLYITLDRSSSEKTVSAVDGTLSYDSNILELVSSSNLMTGWTQFAGISNGNAFGYGNLSFDNLITSTSQNIVKMTFKINSSATYGNTTISITSPSATDEVGDSVAVSGGSHNVKVLSDVNTLSSITISNGSINFNENTTDYNLTIDSDSTNISATKTDSSSSISGDIGNKSLNYGLNTFKITVTSESGKNRVYSINITRPDNRSKINTLSSLKVSSGTLKFDKNTTSYNITVENNISSLKIDTALTDSKSSFVSGYGPRTVNLNIGSNKIEIKVKAENEEVKTYTISVTRKDIDKPKEETKKSNNNYLSEIILSDGIIAFDKEKLEYKVTVLYKVEKIEVTAKTEDSKAKYEVVGNEKLQVGENNITIKVTAEDESIREYKIIVIRKEENTTLSSNSKLKKLTIENHSINFDSNKYEYTIKIGSEERLNITYEAEDTKSSISVNNNSQLRNGSVIKIIVTAEDGSASTYKINIEKSDLKSTIILIAICLLSTVNIILVIWLIMLKKNLYKITNANK